MWIVSISPEREEEGGSKSVEDVVHEERCSLFHCLAKSKESLLKVAHDSGLIETSETKCEFVRRKQAERLTCYSQKALYGYFVRSRDENADELASSYWLTKGDLTFESEGFLIAAQDQALNTTTVQQVYSGSANAQCRLCNTQAETVEQLISGCSQLAGMQYKLRHDNVARYIHWCLCGKHSFERVSNWWKHCPDSIIENDSIKILWTSIYLLTLSYLQGGLILL